MKVLLFTALTLSLLAPATVFAECAELTSRLGAESRSACPPEHEPDSTVTTAGGDPQGIEPDQSTDITQTAISHSCLDGGLDVTYCNQVAVATFEPEEPNQIAAQNAATRIAALMPTF